MKKFKNVLVLAPHTDDGELGAGGFISKLIEEEAKVTYVAFSSASKSVPNGLPPDILKTEVRDATSVLGISTANLVIYDFEVRKLNYVRQEILESLVALRKNDCYDLVLVPCLNDLHQDHSTVSMEAIRAFKNTSIFGYELIWNNLTFNAQCFVNLKESHVKAKILALSEYKSQGFRNYLSSEFILSLAKSRGVQAGLDYAEAYEIIRLFM